MTRATMARGLTALIAGASGLVGGECLKLLRASDRYERVIVVTRRDLGSVARHARVQQVIVDFARLQGVAAQLVADHVYCAMGTTIRKAGSQQRFREVDGEYPRQLAEITLANGASHFSLGSALGASRTSPFFYSRVKGELEDSLRAMHWPSLCFVRPSIIAGDRKESRPMERLAEHALKWAPRTWRPVQARDIAAAMINTALRAPRGLAVIESRDIPAAAAGA